MQTERSFMDTLWYYLLMGKTNRYIFTVDGKIYNFVTTKYPHFNPNSFFVPIFLVTLYPNAIKNE